MVFFLFSKNGPRLTEAFFESGDALKEIVETDSSFLVSKTDGYRGEKATVEAET